MDFGKFGEYGLLGSMIGAIIILLFFIVKWTLSTTRDIINQAAIERKESWKAVNDITGELRKHDEKANERAQYVRAEHKEMIEVLRRMNGK